MRFTWSFFNRFSKILFLLLTPAFFRVFNFAFIWHSIYWGVITFVVMIWVLFLVISPLFGRIGCGWFCFMGTTQDLMFKHSLVTNHQKRPILWLRFLLPVGFFISSLVFFFVHLNEGVIEGIRFIPDFFGTELNKHYQHVWMYDTVGALLLGVFLEKRWACKNLCFMGALCAAGSTYSRLLPVIDVSKCTQCKQCEKVCLVNIPMTEYIEKTGGLVKHSECILCGKCVDACKVDALAIKMVWNRKKFLQASSIDP